MDKDNVDSTDPLKLFSEERKARIQGYAENRDLREAADAFNVSANRHQYTYNFEWLGRPVIQFPQDLMALQEIIWQVKPDLIIETGIAHGGSLIFSASMLALLDLTEGRLETDKGHQERKVLGIDIDIRDHNKRAIENHPLSSRIQMIQGSSIDHEIVELVNNVSKSYKKVMVILDSNHTHDHVLAELELYAPMTSVGSYCVVFDTIVEDLPADMYPDRPWGPGNNPKTAVHKYLTTHTEFEIDKRIQNKIQITVAPDGYLKRLK